MSFTKKIISATFTLGGGTFTGTSSNSVSVKGLRTALRVSESGPVRSQLSMKIYGLTPSVMNNLSTYSAPQGTQVNNSVSVQVGDSTNGLSLFYQGTISEANSRFNEQPEVGFEVTAYVGQYHAVAPNASLSYSGTADVAVILGNLAQQMNLQLENSGVQSKLSNPYFSGSVIDQMKACARAANINALIDPVRGVLAIWPKDGSRGGQIPLISPQTGLVGYPDFSLNQITFKTEFNPNIVCGRQVQLQSSIQPACGTYTVQSIETDLATETPGGSWFQTITAINVGNASKGK